MDKEQALPRANEAAHDLWSQIFERAIAGPNAALHDPTYDEEHGSAAILAKALRDAGWSEDQINARAAVIASREPASHTTSPGVGQGLEQQLREIADRVRSAMSAMGYSSHEMVVLGIDPKVGVSAYLTNVIMTDEGIVSVSSFLFRWCGLIARAYLRTLLLDVHHWSEAPPNADKDKTILLNRPDLAFYWFRIFVSFTTIGTHVLAPFRPSTPFEVVHFEQVAWAMEFYAVSHEYAHHALGHRSSFANHKDQEFEADALAMKVCERLEFEPFSFASNPYARTGAAATLTLRALTILRGFEHRVIGSGAERDTHPLVAERISRIVNRHVLNPNQFKMDRNFNDTVVRIMDAVEALSIEFLERGGTDLLKKMKERTSV